VAARLEPFRVGGRGLFGKRWHYCLTAESRQVVEEELWHQDQEVARRLCGLFLDHADAPLVEAPHLYDYGCPPDAGQTAFVKDATPFEMRKKWEVRGAAELVPE
jgi:hypothetical protein